MSWFPLSIAVFGCSLLAQAQPCHDIRSVDFRNMTIRTATADENELTTVFNASRGVYSFQFKDGIADEFTSPAQRKAGTPEGRAKLFDDSIVNVPGGMAVRFLVISWEHLQGSGSFAVLLGYACQNHQVKEIFQFSAEGTDFDTGPGDQVVIKQAIWKKNDGHCCPSQVRTLYYGWDMDRQKFKRLRVDGPNPISDRH